MPPFRHQVGLGHQDEVGIGELTADRVRHVAVRRLCADTFRIGEDENPVQYDPRQKAYGRSNGPGERDAARLQQNMVGRWAHPTNADQSLHQIIAVAATDAASAKAIRSSSSASIRSASMGSSPNSLTITASLRPWALRGRWLTSVVLPAPR